MNLTQARRHLERLAQAARPKAPAIRFEVDESEFTILVRTPAGEYRPHKRIAGIDFSQI